MVAVVGVLVAIWAERKFCLCEVRCSTLVHIPHTEHTISLCLGGRSDFTIRFAYDRLVSPPKMVAVVGVQVAIWAKRKVCPGEVRCTTHVPTPHTEHTISLCLGGRSDLTLRFAYD